jgi:hypothetical protein
MDKGFETKGGTNESEFFGSFGIVDAKSSSNGDGFNAGFDAGAWGDSGPHEEAGFEVSLDPRGSTGDASEFYDDGQKKDRARRRREGGGSRPGRPPTSDPDAAMESLHISDSDASKKVRRPSKPEDELRRSSSAQGARSIRRGKPRKEGNGEDSADKSGPQPLKGTTSFKKMFQRSKAPDP